MNAKFKKIISYIITFFCGCGAAILSIVLHNRRTDAGVRKELKRTNDINNELAGTIGKAGTTNKEIAGTIGQLEDATRRNKSIFEEIRNQRIEE